MGGRNWLAIGGLILAVAGTASTLAAFTFMTKAEAQTMHMRLEGRDDIATVKTAQIERDVESIRVTAAKQEEKLDKIDENLIRLGERLRVKMRRK